jgi:hypothetical protein
MGRKERSQALPEDGMIFDDKNTLLGIHGIGLLRFPGLNWDLKIILFLHAGSKFPI